jgi:hypothetical protein
VHGCFFVAPHVPPEAEVVEANREVHHSDIGAAELEVEHATHRAACDEDAP